jgi:hypothetical protein
LSHFGDWGGALLRWLASGPNLQQKSHQHSA